jgi:hypothetical protein
MASTTSDGAAESLPPAETEEALPVFGIFWRAWTSAKDAAIRARRRESREPRLAEKVPGRTWKGRRIGGVGWGPGREDNEKRVWREVADGEIRAGVAAGFGEGRGEAAGPQPGGGEAVKVCAGGSDGRERWTEAKEAALRESFESGRTGKAVADDLPSRAKFAAKMRRGSSV